MERKVMKKRKEVINDARKDVLLLLGDGKVEDGQDQIDRDMLAFYKAAAKLSDEEIAGLAYFVDDAVLRSHGGGIEWYNGDGDSYAKNDHVFEAAEDYDDPGDF